MKKFGFIFLGLMAGSLLANGQEKKFHLGVDFNLLSVESNNTVESQANLGASLSYFQGDHMFVGVGLHYSEVVEDGVNEHESTDFILVSNQLSKESYWMPELMIGYQKEFISNLEMGIKLTFGYAHIRGYSSSMSRYLQVDELTPLPPDLPMLWSSNPKDWEYDYFQLAASPYMNFWFSKYVGLAIDMGIYGIGLSSQSSGMSFMISSHPIYWSIGVKVRF